MDRLASLSLIAALAVGSACTVIDDSSTSHTDDSSCLLTLSFVCDGEPSTRSGMFDTATDEIEDINYFIWDRGRCVTHDYVESADDGVSISVSTNGEYTVYAIANAGKELVPAGTGWENDESLMETVFIDRNYSGCHSFPMAGKIGPLYFDSDRTEDLRMVRLVAKVGFRFSPDIILSGQDIKVRALRLCNAADKVFPFSNASSSDSVVGTDDYATEFDLNTINAGGTAYFYAFENCRGTLLPDNSDPWMKVPDEVGEEAALCTYIEVECSIPGNGVLEGDVLYRFYPGDDNTSNFDLQRNTSYTICLCPSRDGLEQMSWKIESNVGYTGNRLAELHKDLGIHPITGTYIGEKFLCSLSEIDNSVSAYFGGSTELLKDRCRLRCIADDGEDDLMEFNLGEAAVTLNCISQIEGTATRKGDGSIWICSADGDKVVPLIRNVSIKAPHPVLSYEQSAEYPTRIDSVPEAIINDGHRDIYMYLCDDDGLNLLADIPEQHSFTGEPYRFTGSLDLGGYIESSEYGSTDAFLDCQHTFDETEDEITGQPFMTFRYGVTNTGEDDQASDMLTDACFSKTPPFNIHIADEGLGLSTGTGASVYFQDIEYLFINDDLTMSFSNPSFISLATSAYEFTSGNSSINADIITDVGKPYPIPSSVCSELENHTITQYNAVAYNTPHIFATPVRRFVVGKGFSTVQEDDNGNIRLIVAKSELSFSGYDAMSRVNSHYANGENAYSSTGIAIDIQAAGRMDSYRIDNVLISAEQDYPNHDEGGYCGTVIFSNGTFVVSDITGCKGYDSCCVFGTEIIYAPSTMDELQSTNAEMGSSVIESNLDGGTVTDYLSFTLKNAKATSLSLSLSLYGEVRVYPKGTSKSSILHLIGPNSNLVQAKINSGSSVNSEDNYRKVAALRTSYSGTVPGNSTTSVFGLKDLITERIFAETEVDTRSKLNASKTFRHQYHPINYMVSLDIRTASIQEIYKGTFPKEGYDKYTDESGKEGKLFREECHYRNSGYLWNNSNDAATTWKFRCGKLDCSGIGYLCTIQ